MGLYLRKTALWTAILMTAVVLAGCGKQGAESRTAGTESGQTSEANGPENAESTDLTQDGGLIPDYKEELQYATRFTLTHYKGGYAMFAIPGADAERQYLIVPEGKKIPSQLPADTLILQQPITNICFASGGLTSLAEAIGAFSCIRTVAIERDGWSLDTVAEAMDRGEILYSGSFRSPDFELLLDKGVQLEIDTAMLLSYPDIMDKYDEMGIPYFVEDSSKEEDPLGRMEWVKLLGAILGREEEAADYFAQQEAKIEVLKQTENTGKTAALFYIGEKGTYVRNGGDYISSMLALAGGNYAMADLNPDAGGNEKVSFEDFYEKCKDADTLFWIVLACPYESREELIASNELFADFKAVQEGRVYSSRRGFAQRTADLADVILEMNEILKNPETEETDTFIRLK